jgi:quercetin dioxygenase-like cupin family protein
VFEAGASPGYGVEVRDWKIPAGKQTESTTLPGAAFVEVLSGGGSLTTGDQKQEIKPGTIFPISQGEAFAIANGGRLPLDLRIYLMMAR